MGRPRSFNDDDVLQKAMMCFWEHGYEGASIRHLEDATGISRISLYNAFTDKEGLFIAVQNKYHAMAKQYLSETLADNSLDALCAFFEHLSSPGPQDSTLRHGCMMVNTVLNVVKLGEAILHNVQAYRELLVDLFESYLERCKTHEPLPESFNCQETAEFIVGSMWGVMAVNRLYQDPSYSTQQAKIMIQTIHSWRHVNG